jgi:tetratricopeptide (TPR) repeat protein
MAGIAYLNKALSLDSTFADAYTALGTCYWWLAEYAPDYTPDYYRQSREYLNKAIALDPYNGLAYSQLAVNQYHNDWDKKAASQSFMKALELNPSDITINETMFWFYLHLQDCDSMEAALNKIREIEPSYNYYAYEVYIKICKGQDRELQAVTPPDGPTASLVMRVELERLMMLKRYDEVLEKMDLYKSSASEELYLELKGEVFGETGKITEALEVIKKLEVLSTTQRIRPVRFAMIYMAIGDEDKAYEYLEKGIEERGLWLHVLPYYSPFYKKRNDPRFQAFMKRTWIN